MTVQFFNDANGNGTREAGDALVPAESIIGSGTAAYADLNNDGQRQPAEPVTQNNDGFASFAALPSGTYPVRGLGGNAYTPTTAGQYVTVTATSYTSVSLGFAKRDVPYSVSGTVYRDGNNNGTRESNEPVVNGTSAVRVYLDADNDGAFDPGETSTALDAAGKYTLVGPAGPAIVRVVPQSGVYAQSSPANNAGRSVTLVGTGPVKNQDFGLAPLGGFFGGMFDDANANNAFDTGEAPLVGYIVYVDLNNDNAVQSGEPVAVTGTTSGSVANYMIGGLLPGTYTIRQILPSGYRAVGSSSYTATISGGYMSAVFADTNSGRASVSGVAYNDANGNGTKDAIESPLQSVTIWDDADNDNVPDGDEQKTVTKADGSYTLAGLPAGTYRLRAKFFDAQSPTTPGAAGYSLTFAADEAKTAVNFGARDARPGTVGGYVFNDTDKDGVKDDDETGIPNVYAFIDYNLDGRLSSNDVVMPTNAGGYWSIALNADTQYRIAFYNQTTRTITTPAYYDVVPKAGVPITNLSFGLAPATGAPASLSGFAFDDSDKDGVYDPGEAKSAGKTIFLDLDNDDQLDTNEKSTKTAADGTWAFGGLAAGTYHVRRVFPSGYSMSTTPIDVALTAGQAVTGLMLGSRSGSATPTNAKTAAISGTAFNDTNRNGKYDSGDTVAAGKTVWLDLDDDGVKDANEASVVTAANGTFAFKTLAAGKYHVRRIFSSGYAESTTARYVTLASGQAVTGVLIGSKTK